MKIKNYYNYITTLILLVFTASVVACSGSGESFSDRSEITVSHHNKYDYGHGKRKKFKFSDDYKGEWVHWRVYTDDGEIVKVIKDGDRLSDSEIGEYKDYLEDKIQDIRENHRPNHRLILDSDDFDFDFDFDVDFDNEQFSESMEKLGEALSNLDINVDLDFDWDSDDWNWDDDCDQDFEWDSDNFRESMRELKHNLKKLDRSNFHIDIDMDGFAEGMEEFAESMKDFKIDMSGLKEELQDLKVELKKLKSFIHEMNEGLVEDGYLEDEDEDYDLEFDKYDMYVNDERVPDNLHRKYIEMYKKYFGHEPENTLRIRD